MSMGACIWANGSSNAHLGSRETLKREEIVSIEKVLYTHTPMPPGVATVVQCPRMESWTSSS